MPGSTVTFKPIEANLTHNTDLVGKMNPYCAFIVGDSIFRGQVCKHGGKHPQWNDAVTIPFTNQSQVIVEVMDKDRFSRDDNIGSFMINLKEIQSTGQSSRWYPLTYKNKPAGEILMETSFSGMNLGGQTGYTTGASTTSQTGYNQAGYATGASTISQTGYNQTGVNQTGYEQSTLNQGFIEGQNQTGFVREEIIEKPIVVEQVVVERELHQQHHHERRVFTEQQQVVEPRTFMKEVDVVETRAHQQNIEVLEPTRVMKEVQYTQAVPVTKQIEVSEPQVVRKEVEVIEPRLVTKTIQVVENVPVMKQVEVIENVTRLQEVQTFEQQTFTKQVEVTDYVPVQKQVTVTEPVHLKKTVEFVEPVITTKTITKEIMEPVIVDQSITTTIGPASVIHEQVYTGQRVWGERFYYIEQLPVEQRTQYTTEFQRLRGTGLNEDQIYQNFQQRGWLHKSHHHHSNQSNWGERFYYIDQLPVEQRTQYTTEFHRLRGTGMNEDQIYQNFDQRGWGHKSHHHSHNPLSTQQSNWGERFYYIDQLPVEQRTQYTTEFHRLRGTGMNEDQIYQNFDQRGWGSKSHNPFSHLSSEQRLFRDQEFQRLRGLGYNDSQINQQLESQGLGGKHSLFNKNH